MTEASAIPASAGCAQKLADLEASLNAVIRGKSDVIRLSVVCLLSRGHLLIEDVPGVGKSTLAHALARSVKCGFHRLQCTADMLPGDILGVTVYNARSGEFEFKPGPIFTNFVLADEINRATPKTQSALLEAMNERQISIDRTTYPMAEPFLVIATQNPVEHHGTYPLPESQLDRFLMRLRIGYPDSDSERQIVRGGQSLAAADVSPVLSPAELLQAQKAAESVTVDESLVGYMLAIVEATRAHESLALGVSPRGAQALYRAVQALSLMEGRDYALPDDVKRLAVPVFAHRVVVNQRVALAARSTETAERILTEILNRIEVPL
ncbi:MAG: MoxR family ATPase [Candidatus Solibacter usitatus]|nr:MoxR family ATPase [Candidatus Solibacter usitatus]